MRLMKLTIVAGLIAATAFPAAAQVADKWTDIKVPPLPDFKIQEPKRIQLDNGMVIFLQPDRELPLIKGTAIVRGGGREVPAGKAGLIDMYGEVWRTGGTKTRTGDQLDDFLEARAALVETNGDIDSTAVTFNTLTEHFDPVFAAFVDVLRNPEFRDDKIALARTQINTNIARRNDDVGGIASREAARLAFGKDSPYARMAEYDTVAAISRDDLMAWHTRWVHPNNIILGISGDFDPKAMEARLRKAFGSWKKGPEAKIPDAPIAMAPGGVYFIPKDDVTQTQLRFVQKGIRKDNPDFFAVEVMNEVLSGGFSGRLMNRLRTAEGLTYGVGGGVGSAWDHPGIFQVQMATKNETTSRSIDTVIEELAKLRQGPITQEEIDQARNTILNSFIFQVDSKDEVLAQRMGFEFYGYPSDWLQRWRAGIEKVTPADVQRVATTYVHPDNLAVLVVGKAAEFDKPLSERGKVSEIDITIPPPGASKPKQAVATDDAGKALVSKVAEWVGGPALIKSINSTRSAAKMTVQTPQGEMQLDQDSLIVFPDRTRRVINTPMGQITMVATPDGAFMKGPMGSQDLPASQKQAMLQELQMDMLYILKSMDDAAYKFAAGTSKMIDGVEARELTIDANGQRMAWWVDPSTGRVLQRVSTSAQMGPPAEQVVTITDWMTVGGLRVPKSLTITSNGEPAGSGEVTSFVINPQIEEGAFTK